MLRALLLASSLLLLAGCALRPRYADFVSSSTAGDQVTFVLLDKDTSRPLPGVGVEVGEAKGRVRVTTAADGTFQLPVNTALLKDNPVIVVAVPRGVQGYVLTLQPKEAPAPAPAEEPAAPPAAPSPTNG